MKQIKTKLSELTESFMKSFSKADFVRLDKLLDTNVKSYMTNREGGVNLIEGSLALITNLKSLDVETVKPTIKITQINEINAFQVLVMIEIQANRNAKSLHNFAAYLITFHNEKIIEIQMVEAKPQYSDEFWKN